jgi:hypothetical protein
MGMAPFVRKEMIERGDELVRFARTVFDEKRLELLRKAADIYRKSTLGQLADMIEREANEWESMGDDIWSK